MTNHLYPTAILAGRYGSTYSGAEWVAFHDYPENLGDALADDVTCNEFFNADTEGYPGPIGRGITPEAAHQDLLSQCPGECWSGAHWDNQVEP